MTNPRNDLVISRQNLPSGFNFGALIAFWLLLTHFAAPTWAFYSFYAFVAVVTIASAVRMSSTTHVDLLAAAEIQELMCAQPGCKCGTADTDAYAGFTLQARELHIHRIGQDMLRLTLCDANGKELYRFKDYGEIEQGVKLILRGIRVETDVVFK